MYFSRHIIANRTVTDELSHALLFMRGSRKFCQRGSKFDDFFLLLLSLFDEGIEDPNNTINGPSSARQRNSI